MNALEKKGHIRKDHGLARAIVVLDHDEEPSGPNEYDALADQVKDLRDTIKHLLGKFGDPVVTDEEVDRVVAEMKEV